MASTGSLPEHKTDCHQDDLPATGLPSMTSTFAKSNIASVPPPVASKRVDGKSVYQRRALSGDNRKSFFQKYVPDPEGEGEGGGGKDGGENGGAKRTLSLPRRSPRSNKNDSGSQGGTKRSTNSLQPFWLKGLIVNKDRSTDSAEFWIENPIHCGYLHAYCLGESSLSSLVLLYYPFTNLSLYT